MAHHLHALHENEKETTLHKSPFIKDSNYSRCPFCGVIESRASIKRHLSKIHGIIVPSTKRITKASVEEKDSDHLNWLGKFYPNEDKNGNGLVECPRCLEKVEIKEFNEHYITHTNECYFCHMTFKYQYQKDLHIAKEHDDSSALKGNQCQICKEIFILKSDVDNLTDT